MEQEVRRPELLKPTVEVWTPAEECEHLDRLCGRRFFSFAASYSGTPVDGSPVACHRGHKEDDSDLLVGRLLKKVI